MYEQLSCVAKCLVFALNLIILRLRIILYCWIVLKVSLPKSLKSRSATQNSALLINIICSLLCSNDSSLILQTLSHAVSSDLSLKCLLIYLCMSIIPLETKTIIKNSIISVKKNNNQPTMVNLNQYKLINLLI